MFNCFIVKKSEEKKQVVENNEKKEKKWMTKYHDAVRPTLLEKYNRRVNNFIARLEDNKKELYEYRRETESKAHELLKQIYKKQAFLGDPTIKLRDFKDWNSLLSTTQRIQKQKNQAIFQKKYGDATVAYRSIASQSSYNPSSRNQFRRREKQKELHPHNMRFTSVNLSFGQNRRTKAKRPSTVTDLNKSFHDQSRQLIARRSSSNNANLQEDNRSMGSLMSDSLRTSMLNEDDDQSVANKETIRPAHPQKQNSNSNKVYFKQIVDFEQHAKDKNNKKTLHQILVRFGISRIKDVKKQAMAETDNLSIDQL